MSALGQLIAAGVEVKALPDGKVRAIGYLTDDLRTLIRAHKPEILAELAATSAAHYAWRVTLPDSPTFEVRILPVQTQAGVEALYPGAIVEPLPETVH